MEERIIMCSFQSHEEILEVLYFPVLRRYVAPGVSAVSTSFFIEACGFGLTGSGLALFLRTSAPCENGRLFFLGPLLVYSGGTIERLNAPNQKRDSVTPRIQVRQTAVFSSVEVFGVNWTRLERFGGRLERNLGGAGSPPQPRQGA